jgi:hypothetical protein
MKMARSVPLRQHHHKEKTDGSEESEEGKQKGQGTEEGEEARKDTAVESAARRAIRLRLKYTVPRELAFVLLVVSVIHWAKRKSRERRKPMAAKKTKGLKSARSLAVHALRGLRKPRALKKGKGLKAVKPLLYSMMKCSGNFCSTCHGCPTHCT